MYPTADSLHLRVTADKHKIDIDTLRQLKDLTLFTSVKMDLSAIKSLFSLSIVNKQPIEILTLEHIDMELGEMLQSIKTLKKLSIRSKCSLSIRVFNSIVALATGHTKVNIFGDMTQTTNRRGSNDEEAYILSQISNKQNEWIRFKEVGYFACGTYFWPNFQQI